MSDETILRVGIVGLGVGRHHIEPFRSHPRADVVAVCDMDETRLEQIGDEFKVSVRYSDMDAMLEDAALDICSIATPNASHAPLTLKALDAGCHVLCEKPMAMNAEEGREMIARAEATGRRLMIDFSYRFYGTSIALKREVDTGVLGDIYFARTIWHRHRGIPGFGRWFTQKSMAGGGPLIDLGVHRIDLALWLMGYPEPEWIVGGTWDHIGARAGAEQGAEYSVEDLAVGMLRFKNGAILEIEASWATNRPEAERMETRLYGTKAGLVHRNRNAGYEFEAELFAPDADGTYARTRIDSETEKDRSAMYEFVDAIVNDRPHPASAEDGLKVMRILDGLYESATTGEVVRFS